MIGDRLNTGDTYIQDEKVIFHTMVVVMMWV